MRTIWRIILGIALVLLGALALLQNFGQIRFQGDWAGIIFGLIFAGTGVGFLVSFFQDRKVHWWAAIPGFTLVGLGLLIFLETSYLPLGSLPPAVFLAGIGVSFWAVYFTDRSRWWAIIPGGVLVSVAALVLVESMGNNWPVIIMFVGMAVTFGLVAMLTGPDEKPRSWAWYPALAMVVLAVILGFEAGPVQGLVWPILLIAAGLVLVGWTFFGKRSAS